MYRKLQQQGRIGRQEQSYTLFSGEEKKPVQNNMIHITLKNNKLNIDKGHFEGSLEAAEEAIQSFADKNDITYESHGHGYGTLSINGIKHGITPYGIDVPMMLEFCSIDASTLTQQLVI